jgi:hypothetical protein
MPAICGDNQAAGLALIFRWRYFCTFTKQRPKEYEHILLTPRVIDAFGSSRPWFHRRLLLAHIRRQVLLFKLIRLPLRLFTESGWAGASQG